MAKEIKRTEKPYVWVEVERHIDPDETGEDGPVSMDVTVWNDSGHPVLLEAICFYCAEGDIQADGNPMEPYRQQITPPQKLGPCERTPKLVVRRDFGSASDDPAHVPYIEIWTEFRYEGKRYKSAPGSIGERRSGRAS